MPQHSRMQLPGAGHRPESGSSGVWQQTEAGGAQAGLGLQMGPRPLPAQDVGVVGRHQRCQVHAICTAGMLGMISASLGSVCDLQVTASQL